LIFFFVIAQKSSTQDWGIIILGDGDLKTDLQNFVLEKGIQKAEVPMSVELGTSDISIQDFLMLDLGDVIELNQQITQPLLIKVGDVPKFIGQPGKANKKMAIQVLEVLKGGNDDGE